MASYSRMLLCYNATHQGRMALREGAALARELNAEAHLLAVVDQLGWATSYDAPLINVDAIEKQTAQEILREGVADLVSRGVFAIRWNRFRLMPSSLRLTSLFWGTIKWAGSPGGGPGTPIACSSTAFDAAFWL